MHSRRRILGGAGSLIGVACFIPTGYAQTMARRPDPKTFQSGDFVWPKKPGAFVPYRFATNSPPEIDSQQWEAERSKFLRANPLSGTPREPASELRDLNYSEFRARYLRSTSSATVSPYSNAGTISVGHIGIIEVDANGESWVIEAQWGAGVARLRYAVWLASRQGELVWHGRMTSVPDGDRLQIPSKARKYIGKPYDFWNFDLKDPSGFYCSKLAWLATLDATGVPLDGDPEPKRSFWLSPKQLLYSARVQRLSDPGSYAFD